MDERRLNHDVVAWLEKRGAFAYKIPDPQGMYATSASKRPFDGFASLPPPHGCLFFESKLIKHKLRAFALNRIEPHQLSSLLRIKQNKSLAVILLGFWKPRTEYWFMLFDAGLIDTLIKTGVKSIKASSLLRLKDKGCCIPLKGEDTFDFNALAARIIHSVSLVATQPPQQLAGIKMEA